MAMLTNAHDTYDEPIGTGGNREDLSDVIFDVSPTETPVVSMMGRTKATATRHDWLTDALESAAANANYEGNEFTAVEIADRSRLNNYTQILAKYPAVTGTQEKVAKAGIKSEMAYQVAQRMKAIKRDLEYALVGASNAKAAGAVGTVREMGSLDAYLATNDVDSATGTASTVGSGDGTDYNDRTGTDAAFTETMLKTALQNVFTNSGGNSEVNLVVRPTTKGVVSTFTASSTRHVTTDDKKLVASIDVYDGDFHTVRVIPDRFLQSGDAYVIDPEYIKLAELRGLHAIQIAKTGDSYAKQLVWECTLEVCNEKAHALITDLSGT